MSAGSIAWGPTWKLGMMQFPAGRPPSRTEVVRPGQFRAPGADELKPSERWQRRDQPVDRALERVGEKSLEAEWQVLVERCLKGDSFAWTELVKAHHRRVYGLCFRFTGSSTDA